MFLTRDELTEELVTLNHGAGAIPVADDGTLMWRYGDDPRTRPLEEVVAELRELLPPPPPLDLTRFVDTRPAPERAPAPAPERDAIECACEAAAWPPGALLGLGALAVMLGFAVGVGVRRRG